MSQADECVPFPAWITSALAIGENAGGEQMAVGLYTEKPWLIKLNRFSNAWESLRPANAVETRRYDAAFLEERHITPDLDQDPDESLKRYGRV